MKSSMKSNLVACAVAFAVLSIVASYMSTIFFRVTGAICESCSWQIYRRRSRYVRRLPHPAQ